MFVAVLTRISSSGATDGGGSAKTLGNSTENVLPKPKPLEYTFKLPLWARTILLETNKKHQRNTKGYYYERILTAQI